MHRLAAPVLGLLVVAGCKLPTGSAAAPTPAAAPPPADRAALMAQLGAPRPEDTGAHYDRDEWGDWQEDGSGCSTREKVLQRDGQGVTTGRSCKVTGGTWTSEYDGVRATDPADLQIDHIVPVAEANRSGARGWTAEQRAAYYNDLDNLVAVSSRSNTQKSDQDPAEWRPVDAFSCEYATAWVSVKVKYRLTADQDEVAALNAMFNRC
ncbi:hypothetical protein BJP25_22195 [Actinokineospora bangkokensis]|uniref:GmrSD restriction endonucleases C-terminal domain-containing protein n=1 Tax=Actinokineospora bangkokensis TaxID=1193682 RepID=A0A1Q9LJQ6_9PSEU|nr:hypothetical protein BJP25_22195 [Actinokineospora bangkokensis]